MPKIDFNVEEKQPVILEGGFDPAKFDLMSPYVWEEANGSFGIMVRVVVKNRSKTDDTGRIFYGAGADGLTFTMDDAPAIAPGPGPLDCGGCEDPTVVVADGTYIVYYTGVNASRTSGQLLYASGRDIRHLTKRGIALPAFKTEGNIKEATIERTAEENWRLFYEYAQDDASRIGLAIGEGVAGPWAEQDPPFGPQADGWDNWHLSTGPLLTRDPDMPVMFYNGATEDARWRIGWVAFDRDCTHVVDRCIEPLITPPPPCERTGVDIAFAASVIQQRGKIYLYYSVGDKLLFRASLKQS